MHRRTKACAIPKDVKQRVYERDKGRCIFCGAPGLPEAHVISRAHGGMGIEQNIVTVCRNCHERMDNGIMRSAYQRAAVEYLQNIYPEWRKEDVIFDKYRD
jgi:5-methylcytosine-specific restriction endonuclease McrA